MTEDELNAWLQDHSIAIFGRVLNPISEIPTWGAYAVLRGYQQTILNFWDQKGSPAANTYPPN